MSTLKIALSLLMLSWGTAHAQLNIDGHKVKLKCKAEVSSSAAEKKANICNLTHLATGEVFASWPNSPTRKCACSGDVDVKELSAYGADLFNQHKPEKPEEKDEEAEFNKDLQAEMAKKEGQRAENEKFYRALDLDQKRKGVDDGQYLGAVGTCQAYKVGRAQVLKAVTCRLKNEFGQRIVLTKNNKDCISACQTVKGNPAHVAIHVEGFKYTTGLNDSGQACESYRVDFVEGARKVLCRVVQDGEESMALLASNDECRSQCHASNDAARSEESTPVGPKPAKKKGGSRGK